MNFCEIDCISILDFAEKVKNKLYIPREKIGIHTINNNTVNELINNIENKSCLSKEEKETSIDFVNKVIEKMRYIDFNEYMSTLKNIANEIQSILETQHEKYDTIIFEANDNYTKSNTWVLLLLLLEMKCFLENHRNILEKIRVVNTYNKDIQWEKTVWFYFDDMSYSGRQIAQSIEKSNNELYIVPIYITPIAKNVILTKNKNVKFLTSTEIINNIEEDFNTNEKFKNIFKQICKNDRKNPIYFNFGCYESQSLVYFDHKIADFLSTLISIIGFGIYPVNTKLPTCKPICETNNLINGCNENNYIQKCASFFHIVSKTGELDCPINWYKQNDFYDDYPYFKELRIIILDPDRISLVEIITIKKKNR